MAGARPFQLGGWDYAERLDHLVGRDVLAVQHVAPELLRVREKKERNLEDGEERRLDGRLEEVDEKKHVSVGGEGFEDGRVEIIEFGPS